VIGNDTAQARPLIQAPLARTLLAVLCASLLFLLMTLPVVLSTESLRRPLDLTSAVLGSAALLLALIAVDGLVRRTGFWWALALLLLAVITVRGSYFAIAKFSGAGFTREVFIHMEWQSLVIAWKDYGRLIRRVCLLILLSALCLMLASRVRMRPPRAVSGVLLLTAIGGIWFARSGLPEAELLHSWVAWKQPVSATVNPDSLAKFEQTGLLQTEIQTKHQILVDGGEQPRNLILVYLESVGRNLVDQDQWPELMPAYGQLLEAHAFVDFLWASSFITIEGLTNSMCGTLFPFSSGNDSMAAGRGLGEGLTCLGDVLDRAGYRQIYMGGAGMNFAGKGAFLAAHGYRDLRGMEYWRRQGLRQRRGTWGLSDADLFEQALDEVRSLDAADQPYNLTLLTIGTHLPGYTYEECAPYPHGRHRFLQALHCQDQLLRQWIDQLQSEGLLDDTLLVITADHHVFANQDMRGLFGDAVYDRRLPFIVIGNDVPEPARTVGAAYDIAPTVLDLLGLEHNATFMLGQSLLKPSNRPDYYVLRYEDVAAGQVIENGRPDCGSNGPGEGQLPLSGCDKAELLSLLGAMVLSQSRQGSRLICNNAVDSMVRTPWREDQTIELVIEGEDLSQRFVYRSRRIDPNQAGVYALGFDEEGWLRDQRFLPMTELSEGARPGELVTDLPRWLLIWVPPEDRSLPTLALPDDSHIDLSRQVAWFSSGPDNRSASGLLGSDEAETLSIESLLCPWRASE